MHGLLLMSHSCPFQRSKCLGSPASQWQANIDALNTEKLCTETLNPNLDKVSWPRSYFVQGKDLLNNPQKSEVFKYKLV